LALVSGAYHAEIFRAGIQSVSRGQCVSGGERLACRAGPSEDAGRHPQATRIGGPPFINILTELLKGTTLLATVGVADLALKAYVLGGQTFRYLEFLSAIALIYFVVIFPVARLAEHVERRLALATR
jgi:ABC-type amino acid transport system permease subunit